MNNRISLIKKTLFFKTIFVLILGCILFISACTNRASNGGYSHETNTKSMAIKKYKEFLSDTTNFSPNDSYISSIRIAYGLIDEDDIPELFVCYGTATVDRVHIYRYDADNNEVDYLGAYSQYGSIIYSEQLNRIQAQYGNNGWFEQFIYKIDENKTEIVGRLLSNNVVYYADYADLTADSVDEVLEGTPDVQYTVSEADYQKELEDYMCGSDTLRISYDMMTPLETDISTN
ncbi:hypothetical protein [Butyrivibrio sp. AC2005]|uniref:hypothetical protein n=1 Tax=Butyrivibrio sp. AC2005 TaxID=1280672 RepID=UPI0004085590|nr:hypothetical protein [Butyrivibrio sp. AC2005]